MAANRSVTVGMLALCGVLVVAGLLVGVSDNPPGIALCGMAAVALILAFAHRLRTWQRMLVLAGGSLVGFPVFAALHNLFYAFGQGVGDLAIVRPVLEFLHALFFIVAVLVCPPGVLVGLLGAVVQALLRRRSDAVRAGTVFGTAAVLIAVATWVAVRR